MKQKIGHSFTCQRRAMKIEDIKLSGKKRFAVDARDVASLEAEWWFSFPSGYREFMTRFGDGILGSFIRIYTPSKIKRGADEWRDRINKHWFWDRGKKILPRERAIECVIIGDTVSGDELIFHPNRPNTLFVLPHESEQVHQVSPDLLSTIEWICTSGTLVRKLSDVTFRPCDSRKEKTQKSKQGKTVGDVEEESLDGIARRGKRWIKRHSPENLAKKDLRAFLKAGQELKLVQEGIGWALNEPAYIALFKIKEKETGRLAGVVSFHTDGKNGGGDRLA